MSDYKQKTWLDTIIEENKILKEENKILKEENKILKEEKKRLDTEIMNMRYQEYRKSLNPNQ